VQKDARKTLGNIEKKLGKSWENFEKTLENLKTTLGKPLENPR
jgi:hypothetical protein